MRGGLVSATLWHHRTRSEQLVTERLCALAPDGSVVMDINYLLKRQRASLAQARNAHCVEARIAHEGLARAYAARLRQATRPQIAPGR